MIGRIDERTDCRMMNKKGGMEHVTIIIYGIIALAVMLGVIALALKLS